MPLTAGKRETGRNGNGEPGTETLREVSVPRSPFPGPSIPDSLQIAVRPRRGRRWRRWWGRRRRRTGIRVRPVPTQQPLEEPYDEHDGQNDLERHEPERQDGREDRQ